MSWQCGQGYWRLEPVGGAVLLASRHAHTTHHVNMGGTTEAVGGATLDSRKELGLGCTGIPYTSHRVRYTVSKEEQYSECHRHRDGHMGTALHLKDHADCKHYR